MANELPSARCHGLMSTGSKWLRRCAILAALVCTLSGQPIIAAGTTIDDLPVPCMKGLSPAAEAEQYMDSSDTDRAVAALQESIRGYGQCLALPDLSDKQKAYLLIHRAYERMFIVDEFKKQGRQDDSNDQLNDVGLDLYLGCNNYDLLAPADRTTALISASLYVARKQIERPGVRPRSSYTLSRLAMKSGHGTTALGHQLRARKQKRGAHGRTDGV